MSVVPKYRRTEIKRAVLSVLQAPGNAVFPVPVKRIARSLPNCHLIPYSKLAQDSGVSTDEFIRLVESRDAFTDYIRSIDGYIISYNDCSHDLIESNRYRWNIAHEIGHVVLQHHTQNNILRIRRNPFSDKEHRYLDAEADLFAKYLLIPYAALKIHGVRNVDDFRRLCKISKAAANNQIKDYNNWLDSSFKTQYDYLIARAFIHYYHCPECGYIGHLKDGIHICSQCGNKTIAFYNPKEDDLKYNSIPLNEHNKAQICPICNNEHTNFVGDYCQICGTLIINKCSSGNDFGSNYCPGTDGLDGDARFCPYCGHKSTFLQNGILKPWNFNTISENETSFELPEFPFDF